MENQTHHEHTVHPHQEKFSIPASIIVGAILISGSLFYNTKLILQAVSGSAVGAGQALQNLPSAPLAPNQPGAETPSADLAERKDAAVLGKSSAKVKVTVFTDFQCPFCQRFYNDAYKQIKEKYVDAGKAKIIYRHYPLPFHQSAQKAGEAAECANRQGKFVNYHNILFEKGQGDGTGLDNASLKQYAVDLKLNIQKFNSCLDNGETAEIVKKDMADAAAAGVSGTPTIFVGKNKIVGALPFASFQDAIEAALK